MVVEGYLDFAIELKGEGTVLKRPGYSGSLEKDAEYLHGWQECWNNGIVKDPPRNEIVWAISDEELER